jgi:hypothetical protein
VVTLGVFVPFFGLVSRQTPKLDHLWAGPCMIGTVYFMFPLGLRRGRRAFPACGGRRADRRRKTSLARRLAAHWDTRLVLEQPARNPFLPAFYEQMAERARSAATRRRCARSSASCSTASTSSPSSSSRACSSAAW